MNNQFPRLTALRRELESHWHAEQNWTDLDDAKIRTLAKMRNCTPKQVKVLMKEIAKRFPASKTKYPAECQACGNPIVWMGNKPFDPEVLTGAGADGVVQRFRQLHKTTCPHADKWGPVKSGHADAVPSEVA